MRRVAVLLVLSLSAFSSCLHAQSKNAVAHSARLLTGIDSHVLKPLQGIVPDYVKSSGLTSEPLSADTELTDMVLVLKRAPEVQAAFEQLLKDQLDPTSPRYHQWLLPQQVGELYGAAPSDIDAVKNWLASQGLTVTGVQPNGIAIHFKGNADVVAHAFSTSFRNYHFANGEARYSVAETPSVPASIASIVDTVCGLTQEILYAQARQGEFVAAPASNLSSGNGNSTIRPNYTSSSTGRHYMVAGDFALVYNINSVYSAGYTGAGQKVAVIGRSRTEDSDISTLQNIQGQTVKQPNVIIPPSGTDPGKTLTNDQVEATLDVNRVSGTAPDATIDLVVSKSGSTDGIRIAVEYAISTVNDPIISISFGGCEYLNGSSTIAYYDSMFSTASSQGISVFVSSGDDGVASCNTFYSSIPSVQVRSINEICSTSYVTCVGGTEFIDTTSSAYWNATNATKGVSVRSYIPEGAWNDVTLGTDDTYSSGATGGGQSNYVYQPSWQKGTGNTNWVYRWVPDMSFNASPNGGFVTFLSYKSTTGFYSYGGTSVAAPSMAGVQALMNQKLGGRQGNVNKLLYALGLTPSAAVYHDVTPSTTGLSSCNTAPSLCNNSTPSSTSLTGGLSGYLVAEGWDAATGWGSMNVANYLASSSLKPTSLTFTLAPSAITAGQTTSVTATVTAASGTPTGTLRVTINGNSTTGTLSSGTATVTSPVVATGGTYDISVAYLGSTDYTGSSSVGTLNVSNLPATTTTLSLANNTITIADTDVLTANVTSGTAGTISGTVSFYDGPTLLGSGSLSSGIATCTLTAGQLAIGTHTLTAVYAGNSSYFTSTSASKTLTVNGLPSTTTLTPVSSTITTQQTVTFTATVSGASGTPTGTVTFLDGANALGSGTLSGGVATYTSSTFSAGTHTVTAMYNGSATYAASTSGNSVITVTAIPSTTSLNVSATSINQTQPLTLTATVSGAGGTPAGSVQFLDGSQLAGTASLINGVATYVVPAGTFTISGTHAFSANYIGGGAYAASSSAASNVTVTIVSFSLSASTSTLTLSAGATTGNTVTISATGNNGFSSTSSIALGCTVNSSVASAPVCTINPATITTASTATLTVSTTAAHVAGGDAVAFSSRRNIALLCGLFLFGLPFAARRRIVRIGLLTLLFAIGLISTSGCGSGGNSGGGSGGSVRTPAGTYTVTVTGTSSGVTSQVSTISVTVN